MLRSSSLRKLNSQMSHLAGGVVGTGAGAGVEIETGSTGALDRDFLPRLFEGAVDDWVAVEVELTTTGATGATATVGVGAAIVGGTGSGLFIMLVWLNKCIVSLSRPRN